MNLPRRNDYPLYFDVFLLFPVLMLTGIGVVMVYSASSHLAAEKFGDSAYFLKRQVLFALAGISLMIFFRYLNYRVLRVLAYVILAAAFILLGLVFVAGVGFSANGATRWLRIGGFSFQPSELAKYALIIYLAYSLNKKQDNLNHFSIGFLPHVFVLGAFAILILFQPDFGSVVVFGLITWIMLFVGGARLMHLFMSFIFLLPAAVYYAMQAQYRLVRLICFLDPWRYQNEGGYQIIHSFMAFGTGGIWGTGIGQGYQKLFYLPEPHTDFIFSVIGEELGLWGVCLVLTLFMILLWRGVIIARATQDRFGALLALGLTAAISFQVFVNTGVAVGILPTKGITLPFLSYGGTSLVFNLAAAGILMSIGHRRDA
ncbi:MAG: putative lipid II flippase FtsW [Thermodesulfobacteriota bacterium]